MPSSNRLLRLPSFQDVSLLSRQAACSLALEVLCGFCRRRSGRKVAALSATDSRAETEAKDRYSLDSSSLVDYFRVGCLQNVRKVISVMISPCK